MWDGRKLGHDTGQRPCDHVQTNETSAPNSTVRAHTSSSTARATHLFVLQPLLVLALATAGHLFAFLQALSLGEDWLDLWQTICGRGVAVAVRKKTNRSWTLSR
jgi:hypothetical protein